MVDTNHRRDNDSPRPDKALKKLLEKLGWSLLHIEGYVEAIQEDRPTLVGFRVKCDPDDEQGVLVIGKGYLGSADMVCFHRDVTVSDAVSGFGNRLRNGSLKWREDHGYDNNG